MCVMSMKNYKRTVLITGATDGIGRQVALELSSKYDENFVIIHGRCKKKCEATLDFLIQENKLRPASEHSQQSSEDDDASSSAASSAGTAASNLDYVTADFAHVSEICRMAEEVKLRFPRLNTFMGCASVLVPRKMNSQDGNELTLQVNHLSHYILWNSLLPLLESNAPSRIITVGSMLHSFNSINWEDINCEKGMYDKFLQYSRTKLMNHLGTFYIHRLLFKHGKQFQVTANVVDADQQTDRRLRTYANHFNALSASESHLNAHANGIQTLVKIVESNEFLGISGKYFDANGREMRKNAEVGDVRLQDRLWETSRNLCAKLGIESILPTIQNCNKLITHNKGAKNCATNNGTALRFRN